MPPIHMAAQAPAVVARAPRVISRVGSWFGRTFFGSGGRILATGTVAAAAGYAGYTHVQNAELNRVVDDAERRGLDPEDVMTPEMRRQYRDRRGFFGNLMHDVGKWFKESKMFGVGSLVGAGVLGGLGAWIGGAPLAIGGALLGGLATQPILNAFTGGGNEQTTGTGGTQNGNGSGNNPNHAVAQNPHIDPVAPVTPNMNNGLNNGIRPAPIVPG